MLSASGPIRKAGGGGGGGTMIYIFVCARDSIVRGGWSGGRAAIGTGGRHFI